MGCHWRSSPYTSWSSGRGRYPLAIDPDSVSETNLAESIRFPPSRKIRTHRELGSADPLRRRRPRAARHNATERAIRGPVVGRKKHYGSKSRRGTEVAATLYTVLETAKLHAIDPSPTCMRRSPPLIAASR